MKLLALLFAFVISHYISSPEKFRNFNWLQQLRIWVVKQKFFESSDVNMLLILFIPIVIIQLLAQTIFDSNFGIFLVSVLILIYCIGPQSLEEQLPNYISSNDEKTIKVMTQESMNKWFGVFFWYVVLGIVGVLIYRFTERLCYNENDSDYSKSFNKLLRILNYPVSWMVVLALAIASDFERVYLRCKPFLNLETVKAMDNKFLFDAMDFAVNNCEADPVKEKKLELVTLDVLKRMLIVCLVFVSILVILAI